MTSDNFTTLDWIFFSAPAVIVVMAIVGVAIWEIIADWRGWDA